MQKRRAGAFQRSTACQKDKRVLISNIRLVAGENGLSVGERTFASGAREMSVSALDSGKGRRRQLRLVGPTERWTDALLETIKLECLDQHARSKEAKAQSGTGAVEAELFCCDAVMGGVV